MGLDDERPDVRVVLEEDREDDTDRAIKRSREYVIEAVEYLASVLQDSDRQPEDRLKAASLLLEVSGCL